MKAVDLCQQPGHQWLGAASPLREQVMLSVELPTTASTIASPRSRTVAAGLATRADFDPTQPAGHEEGD